MVQPPSMVPRTLRTGTRTFSKYVSQKWDFPERSLVGRTRTPGVSRSISRKVIPACFFAAGFVRTRQNIQSERSP